MKTRKITELSKHMPKYPKTPHIEYSGTIQSDDKVATNIENYHGKRVIVSLKMDGEGSNMTCDYYHARSVDTSVISSQSQTLNSSSNHHESRSWIKAYHAQIRYMIPPNLRLCGENLFAMHSIYYENLENYFYLFNIWNRDTNICMSWDDTVKEAKKLGLPVVPVLYDGIFDYQKIKGIFESLDYNLNEGIVIRIADEFHYDDFSKNVIKAVRPNHIDNEEYIGKLISILGLSREDAESTALKHWTNRPIIQNHIKK